MARLVDSTVFMTLERRRLPLAALGAATPNERMVLASVTLSELLLGAHYADTEARRRERLEFVEAIISQFPVVPFDATAARVHAGLWAHLRSSGQMIGPHDLIIAATAVALGCDVLTDNLREFRRVPGLTVVQPDW